MIESIIVLNKVLKMTIKNYFKVIANMVSSNYNDSKIYCIFSMYQVPF